MRMLALTLAFAMFSFIAIANPGNDSEINATISIKKQLDNRSVLYTEKYLNGQIANQGIYFKKKKHGLWQKYAPDGTLICEFNYDKGKREGTGKVYEDGNLKYTIIYSNGNRVAVYELDSPNTYPVKNQ